MNYLKLSEVMSYLKLYLLTYLFWNFFFCYSYTALLGQGLLIFEASRSHSGVHYRWQLYTLIVSEFISSILHSLAIKSERVKFKSVHLYSPLAG